MRRDDAEALDRLMDYCRLHASAGGMATRPIVLEAAVTSILLHQEKTLARIKEKLSYLEKRDCEIGGEG